jgi:hypothetical protein
MQDLEHLIQDQVVEEEIGLTADLILKEETVVLELL